MARGRRFADGWRHHGPFRILLLYGLACGQRRPLHAGVAEDERFPPRPVLVVVTHPLPTRARVHLLRYYTTVSALYLEKMPGVGTAGNQLLLIDNNIQVSSTENAI